MHDAEFLTKLLVLVACAAAGAALFERLRLPQIAGFLVAGALVGPNGAGFVSNTDDVRSVAEFGVVFLLFEIGLELPIDRLHRMLRRGFAAGAVQVAATLALTAAAALAFGMPWPGALVLGALVAMSSTALVIGMLAERGEGDAPHGQVAIAMVLFQDLCIVLFLLAVPLLAAPQLQLWPLLGALAAAAAALVLMFVLARFVLPRALDWAARLRSRELFSLTAVGIVLGSAFAAGAFGLTPAVGAFLAGLAASASPYGPQLQAEILPLRGVLLGVFFTAVGMLIAPEVVLQQPALVLAFALAATVGKAAIAALAVRSVLRAAGGVSLRAGLALGQTGEFSFVLVAVAAEAGLLSLGVGQAFVAASVLSLLASPFLVRFAPRLSRLAGLAEAARKRAAPSPPALHDATEASAGEGQVVLVGFGLAGRNVARVLDALGVAYAGVDSNPHNTKEARALGKRIVWGDAVRPALLRHLGVADARLVVVAINDALATRQVVEAVRQIAPRIPLLVRARYVQQVDALQNAGATLVVAEELEGAIDLVAKVLGEFNLDEDAVAQFGDVLRGEGYALLQAPPALGLDPWLTELLRKRD